MRHGSLFSGIGGFDLAAEWMGWTNVFHTEWNEFGQKVLQHHFPNSISYHDIIKTDYTIHNGDIDIITGGFPCQPFSLAGKRKGTDDERYLWHEMLRAIQQIRPTYVVAENVRGLLTIDAGMVFEQVCADLEAEGYEVQPLLLPAAGVNAPHRRDRIFIVGYAANTNSERWKECNNANQSNKKNCRQPDQAIPSLERWKDFPTESAICGGNDGIPHRLDNITFPKWRNESIKAYGNAVVPQLILPIFQTIEKLHRENP
jgi:DNA (cytosine-5)-methyltransferase 1